LHLSRRKHDKIEVFGGYSYMYLHNSPSANLNGWEIAGQYKFTDWLGGVADLDVHYGSSNGIGTSTYTYLFGPQISLPSRVSPFAHLLLGSAHISEAGFGRSSFSMALGGGVDVCLSVLVNGHTFKKTAENAFSRVQTQSGVGLRLTSLPLSFVGPRRHRRYRVTQAVGSLSC
jgi:hypothetical protein